MAALGLPGYEAWCRGDDSRFEETLKAYNKRLIYYVYRKLGNITYAEDTAAEVFVRLLMKKPKFKDEAQLCAWLFKAAHNCALDTVRKNKFSAPTNDEISELSDQIEIQDIESSLVKDEESQLLHISLNEVKYEYKEVLILLYFENMSYSSISKIMGKSEKQIKNLAYRARLALKQLLEGKGYTYAD